MKKAEIEKVLTNEIEDTTITLEQYDWPEEIPSGLSKSINNRIENYGKEIYNLAYEVGFKEGLERALTVITNELKSKGICVKEIMETEEA